jgi:hypothetical protein
MDISYTRIRHYGSQSEYITIADKIDYSDQADDVFNRIKAIACKALNVLPYESTEEEKPLIEEESKCF